MAQAVPCPIDGFTGLWFDRDSNSEGYETWCYQYASTAMGYSQMKPKLILVPMSDEDVIRAVEYARANGINIAVRTGGHQYCGASSTDGENIQLDMSKAYKEDFVVTRGADGQPTTVTVGISHALVEFNRKLGNLGLFVPHGQCSHVHLGGHVQTGGYGQLGRSFGLFADHVLSIDIITADSRRLHVERGSADPEMRDLYYAVLGGSPGNFGVLTHITIVVHRDEDFPYSRGFRGAYVYNKDVLARMLELVAQLSARERDYDMCVTVLTSDNRVFPSFWWNKTREDDLRKIKATDEYKKWFSYHFGTDKLAPFWPSMIIVYAQWANTGGAKQEPSADVAQWFQSIKTAGRGTIEIPDPDSVDDGLQHVPMSKLTTAWLFLNVREYLLPFEKRCYVTDRTGPQLHDAGWPEWCANRIDEIQSKAGRLIDTKVLPSLNQTGCKLAIQIQNFGGEKSMFYKNGQQMIDGKHLTAFSWRDTTVCSVMDCFYDTSIEPKARDIALEWHKRNEDEGFGPSGKFSSMPREQARRLLWGSHGDRNMGNVHSLYYPDDAYHRLVEIKNKFDPKPTVFTPNHFCVGAPEGIQLFPPATPDLPEDGFAITRLLGKLASKIINKLDIVDVIGKSLDRIKSFFGLAHFGPEARSLTPAAIEKRMEALNDHLRGGMTADVPTPASGIDAYMSECIKHGRRPQETASAMGPF